VTIDNDRNLNRKQNIIPFAANYSSIFYAVLIGDIYSPTLSNSCVLPQYYHGPDQEHYLTFLCWFSPQYVSLPTQGELSCNINPGSVPVLILMDSIATGLRRAFLYWKSCCSFCIICAELATESPAEVHEWLASKIARMSQLRQSSPQLFIPKKPREKTNNQSVNLLMSKITEKWVSPREMADNCLSETAKKRRLTIDQSVDFQIKSTSDFIAWYCCCCCWL